MRKALLRTTTALLAVALLGACGGGGDNNAADDTNTTRAADDTNTTRDGTGGCTDLSGVKIGVPYDLTGAGAAAAGIPASQGTKLALRMLEDDGILPKGAVTPLNEDAGSDANKYVAAVTKLARQDHVSAITGFSLTGGAIASGPAAEDAKVPVVAASTVGPGVGELGPHWFRMALQDDYLYSGTLPEMMKLLEPAGKKVGALFQADAAAHVASNEHFKKAFEDAGASYKAESITANDNNYSPQLTELKGVDILIINANAGLEPQMATTARQLGINAQIVGNIGLAGRTVIDTADGAFEGGVFASPYFAGVDNELNKKFVAAYTEEYGQTPDVFSAFGYEAMRFLGLAIADACSGDSAEILTALNDAASGTFDSIFGDVTFDAEGNAKWQGQVVQIKNDDYVLASN